MTDGPTAAILWLRRDLRLHDHPALHAALAGSDLIVPLFVLDPRLLNGRFASPNRTWFLLGTLEALRDRPGALCPLPLRSFVVQVSHHHASVERRER